MSKTQRCFDSCSGQHHGWLKKFPPDSGTKIFAETFETHQNHHHTLGKKHDVSRCVPARPRLLRRPSSPTPRSVETQQSPVSSSSAWVPNGQLRHIPKKRGPLPQVEQWPIASMASQKSFPSQEDERLVNFGITGEQSLIPKLQCFPATPLRRRQNPASSTRFLENWQVFKRITENFDRNDPPSQKTNFIKVFKLAKS